MKARGQVPVPPVLAVLRFPRTPPMSRGRDVVTTPERAVVMTLDVTDRGRQVDVAGPDGAPFGRIRPARKRTWELVAPHTLEVLATADPFWGREFSVGAGPETRVKGRGDEWDLVWGRGTPLLSTRRVPRRVAKQALDVWVSDPAFTPAVVAFVVHVHRWWQASEATQQLLQAASTAGA